MAQIVAENLTKVFKVPQREAGLGAAMVSLFRRRHTEVRAVAGVSFSIDPGEIVGFLGPNGAGKTTTLKILTGLLHPTSGRAEVLGHIPWRRQHDYLRRISLVMGQRSQLNWDLPAMDSFVVHQAIYAVDESTGKAAMDELIALLELAPLLKKPVRNLSLGERMKCELCLALLHRPQVLFLDEPTIGLDVTMQARLRQFIAEYNRRTGATVILTSHYMADVTALCRRIIVINRGRIPFDGPLDALVQRMAPFKVVEIDLERDVNGEDLTRFGEPLSHDARRVKLRVPKDQIARVTARVLAELPVLDLTVQDPPIEDVIAQAFQQADASAP